MIISDIEGSSGCFDYQASALFGKGWPYACRSMSLDANAVARALFSAGAESVLIKDFHRTGYNLFPELIDSRAKIISGYKRAPVPGIGDPENAQLLMMIGMHAPSASGGFLAHTLTSRISKLTINGKLISEAELFSASLAPFGLIPVFFSGCGVACEHAKIAIEGISVYPIDKSAGPKNFNQSEWREGLAHAAAASLDNSSTRPYNPIGPFSAEVTMRGGYESAKKHASPWGFKFKDDTIFIERDIFADLYFDLIRLCYLTPITEKLLSPLLPLYNLFGYLTRQIAKAAGQSSPLFP